MKCSQKYSVMLPNISMLRSYPDAHAPAGACGASCGLRDRLCVPAQCFRWQGATWSLNLNPSRVERLGNSGGLSPEPGCAAVAGRRPDTDALFERVAAEDMAWGENKGGVRLKILSPHPPW